ncbi:MAG: LemA family protein [Kangiellaceae bacterium]|jgi:LemA protein|nr:LemA family protein [Kangiellaceae bacterium]
MEWVVLGLIVIAIFYAIGIYNKLVSLKNLFKRSFSQIDVQLNRRYDLIPNLVETAKAFMSHERETLEAVVQARSQAMNANQAAAGNPADSGAMQALMGAETALTGAMGKFFAVMENYPEIKSNETMTNLMDELAETENKIALARHSYNDSVMHYNTYREQFPNTMIASRYGFKAADLFEVDDPEAKKPVKVSFD